MRQGLKLDGGKIRYSLLPGDALRAIVEVLEFGARKYAPGNWEHVEDAETRYFDAGMRHFEAWRAGEWADNESGAPHLAHLGCCVLFLLTLGLRKRGNP